MAIARTGVGWCRLLLVVNTTFPCIVGLAGTDFRQGQCEEQVTSDFPGKFYPSLVCLIHSDLTCEGPNLRSVLF